MLEGVHGGGMLAQEVRRGRGRGIGANVEVEDSRMGTRGQLVGGTVEVQVDNIARGSNQVRVIPGGAKEP